MTPKEFCYWLQGSLELNENEEFNEKQTEVLKRHLSMVFNHIAHLEEKDQPPVHQTQGFHPESIERC